MLGFPELREQRWTNAWLRAEVERLAARPEDRVLAVFDVFDGWFHRPDFEGCAFVNTLLETRHEGEAVHRAAVNHIAVVREIVRAWAAQAGAIDAQEVGSQLELLMLGAIVSAGRGDLEAAKRARGLAELLLDAAR